MAVNTRSRRKERQSELIDLTANHHSKENNSVKDFCSSSENCIPVAQNDTNMSNISDENDCSAPVEVSIRVVGSPQAETIRVRVHPDLEVEILERVVATAAYGSFDNRRIYLLFRESDSLGISLYDLARNAAYFEGDIFTVQHPFFREGRFKGSIDKFSSKNGLQTILLFAVFSFGLKISWESHEFLHDNSVERLLLSTATLPLVWANYVFEHPMRWYYRNGPTVLGGWGGNKLQKICEAMIPAIPHFDEGFWEKESELCLKIYAEKEEQMLNLMKPIVLLFCVWIVFLFLWKWISIKASTKPNPK